MKKIIIPILLSLILLSSCKKDYQVERSILIDAPKDLVWEQIKYFHNWQSWSPWYAKDSTMIWTFEGNDGDLESSYSWTSEDSGSGSMLNTGVVEGEELLYQVQFFKPFKSQSDGYLKLKDVNGSTEVVWGFTGTNKGIFALFFNMDKMVGPDFEAGLELLKQHCLELEDTKVEMAVEVINLEEQDYIAIRENIDISGIQNFFARNFGAIMETGIEMQGGYPSGFYYTWDVENMQSDMAAAIPIAKASDVPEGFSRITIPGGKALLINYYGDYNEIGPAHELMESYMLENNLEYIGPAIEEYVSDPMEESNPSKWLTRVIYPVK
ncbi:MAG: GyrI-like domain-containing protein [Chitinophagales bacterium]|nr:GyrI-like domain-containing protein [Chitinophagales bacterium]